MSAVKHQLTYVRQICSTMDSFAALRQDGSVVTCGSEASGGNSCSVQAQLQAVQEIFSTMTQSSSGASRTSVEASIVQICTASVKFIHGSAKAFAAVRYNGSIVTWGAQDGGGDSSAVQSAFATF